MWHASFAVTHPEKFQLDNEGWQTILKKTSDFKSPAVQQNVLTSNQIIDFRKWIFDVVRFICLKQTTTSGFQLCINNEMAGQDYLQQHIYPFIPEINADGTQWIKRVFKEQIFGIKMNYNEKFSLKIAEALSEMVKPLLDEYGLPSYGIHTTVYIGNYNVSPFQTGPNRSDANSIYFNLGPGTQTIYTWNTEVYQSIEGQSKTLEELIPFAENEQVATGDLFLMPSNQYYLLQNEDLSIGLTLWFDNYTNKELFERLLKSIQRQIRQEGLQLQEEYFVQPIQLQEVPIKNLLKTAFSDFKIALFSNRGWKGIPLTIEQVSDFKLDEDFLLLKNKEVQLPYPFQIYYKQLNTNELLVYARGAKITIKYHHLVAELIDRLNTNESVATSSLLIELNRKWPEQAGLYFLAILYNKRAINIVD